MWYNLTLFLFKILMCLLHNPAWSLKKQTGKVHPSLPKHAFFQSEQEHLVFSPYLHTQNLICLLQCFPCFVLPMSRNYSSSVCLCSKQITIALVLSSGQPNVCFLFKHAAAPLHCPHLLIVFASVCPLLFMEDKTARVQGGSLEVYSPCSQAVHSLPGVWQEAFCHLRHATSPTYHPAPSSNPINTSIWGRSDDLVCWRWCWHHTCKNVDDHVYF